MGSKHQTTATLTQTTEVDDINTGTDHHSIPVVNKNIETAGVDDINTDIDHQSNDNKTCVPQVNSKMAHKRAHIPGT